MALLIAYTFPCALNFENELTALLTKNANAIDNNLTDSIFELNHQQRYFERTTNPTSDTVLYMQRSAQLPDYLPNLAISLTRAQLSLHTDDLDLKLETVLTWERPHRDWMQFYVQYCNLLENIIPSSLENPAPLGGNPERWSAWGATETQYILDNGSLPPNINSNSF